MPLTFDMPLEQLKTYLGTNPLPPDFDSFWDQGIAEMRAMDPEIELLPANFQTGIAECHHLYFTGVGGARLHAKLLRPRVVEAPHPAVLMFMDTKTIRAIGRGNWATWHRGLPWQPLTAAVRADYRKT